MGWQLKLSIYDNPLGIMTNAPNFPYMMTHLRNYVGLNDGQWTSDFNGIKIAPTGHGAGMFGTPGDITPPSRFVNLAVAAPVRRSCAGCAALAAVKPAAVSSDEFGLRITRGTIVDRNAASEVTASKALSGPPITIDQLGSLLPDL